MAPLSVAAMVVRSLRLLRRLISAAIALSFFTFALESLLSSRNRYTLERNFRCRAPSLSSSCGREEGPSLA